MGDTTPASDLDAAAQKLPILYSFRRCPYAMRARLALHASAIPVELREIVLRDKPPEMLAASPKGTVPVMITPEGDVLEESLDVMLWALSRHDPECWLEPRVGDIERMLTLIAGSDFGFKKHLDAYKYASRDAPDKGVAARQAGMEFLKSLDDMLVDSQFLFGDRIALADMAIFPFVRQFANVDRSWFDDQNWPHLRRWLDGLLVSARFNEVMNKYPKWEAGDEPVYFGAETKR
jgi:glutathione S-transferase